MKSMIHRTLDQLGRVVIPVDYRETLGLNPGDVLEISLSNGSILTMTPVRDRCVICGTPELLLNVKARKICAPCLTDGCKRLSDFGNQ